MNKANDKQGYRTAMVTAVARARPVWLVLAIAVLLGPAGGVQAQNMCSAMGTYDGLLVLTSSGVNNGAIPSPNPWRPRSGSVVQIRNDSGANQTLTDISPGLLVGINGGGGTINQIVLTANGPNQIWTGRVGNACGTYTYDDGEEPEEDDGTAPRAGTIDPS